MLALPVDVWSRALPVTLLLPLLMLGVACRESLESEQPPRDSIQSPGALDSDRTTPTDCSLERYRHYESLLSIADSEGHGPDLGSAEWKSAVEWKLGLTETTDPGDTESWCARIDRALAGDH